MTIEKAKGVSSTESSTEGTSRVLDVLAHRRKRRRLIGIACAVMAVACLCAITVRAYALACAFPNPDHKFYSVDETIEYPGFSGGSLRVEHAGYLDNDAMQSLCPENYAEWSKSGSRFKLYRIDFAVTNGGSDAVDLWELSMSTLTIGSVYGNAAYLPAMQEAFPDISHEALKPGETRNFTYLYLIWDVMFSDVEWDGIEGMPMGFQFNMWPDVMAVKLQ